MAEPSMIARQTRPTTGTEEASCRRPREMEVREMDRDSPLAAGSPSVEQSAKETSHDASGGNGDSPIKAFERDWRPGVALYSFLPDRSHPHFLETLRELVRLDLELAWEHGRGRPLEEYRREFPELFADQYRLADLAWEEYSGRLRVGERPTLGEYAERFGVSLATWAVPGRVSAEKGGVAEEEASPGAANHRAAGIARRAAVRYLDSGSADQTSALTPSAAAEGDAFFAAIAHRSPGRARRAAAALADFPGVGRDFLHYRLDKELGRTAFGRTFLATTRANLDATVVLKLVIDGLYDGPHGTPPLAIKIYDAGQHSDLFHVAERRTVAEASLLDVVLELNRRPSTPDAFGEPLKSLTAAPKMEFRPGTSASTGLFLESLVRVAASAVSGLERLHADGLVHHNLKPANILLDKAGEAVFVDPRSPVDANIALTHASLGGSLAYLAPEQIQALLGHADLEDPRCDVYSLGVVLYQLFTGRFPFLRRNGPAAHAAPRMIEDRVGAPPKLRPYLGRAPGSLEAIIRKCLQSNVRRRYASAAQLKDDLLLLLDRLQTPAKSLSRRLRFWNANDEG